jgi:hypothetical protein
LEPLLLELQTHHATVLHAQSSISAVRNQAPVIQHLLRMAAHANIDQLQELLLRLLQLAAGRQSSSVAEGAAVALHCLFYTAGPHTCYVGAILAQPRSQELLQAACRNSSSSSCVQAVAADMRSREVDDLLLPALQAPPDQVSAPWSCKHLNLIVSCTSPWQRQLCIWLGMMQTEAACLVPPAPCCGPWHGAWHATLTIRLG